MGKLEKTVVVFLLLVFSVSAILFGNAFYKKHSIVTPGSGGQLIEALVGQPRLLNPVIANSVVDNTLNQLIYSGLYKIDSNGTLVPDLAFALPTISEDQKTYTVKIRPDALWHNQKPVTADDVIYTIQTIQNPNYKSPLRNSWLNITVEKIGDLEIAFTNKDISAPFVNNLTLPIMPSLIWQNVTPQNFPLSELNLKAVGSGPYKISEITKLPSGDISKLTLTSFNKYFGGTAYIDKLQFNFYSTNQEAGLELQTGKVDSYGISPFMTTDLKLPGDTKQTLIPSGYYQALFFNLNREPLSDISLRQALAGAINKQALVQQVYGNNANVLTGPILPQQLGFTNINQAQISDEAINQLINKAGWALDSNGERIKKQNKLSLQILTNDSQMNIASAQFIAESWKRFGISVEVKTLPGREITDQYVKSRDFDVLIFGQKVGVDPDPFAFWHSSQVKDPGLNITGFIDQETDQVINSARTSNDPVARAKYYQRFQEIMIDKVPAIFLAQGKFTYLIKSKVNLPETAIIYDISSRFNNVSKWYINESRSFKWRP